MDSFWPLCLYFLYSKYILCKKLPRTGFEPGPSVVKACERKYKKIISKEDFLNGTSPPLFFYFRSFLTNINTIFTTNKCEKAHALDDAGIQTHNLQIMSLITLALDLSSRTKQPIQKRNFCLWNWYLKYFKASVNNNTPTSTQTSRVWNDVQRMWLYCVQHFLDQMVARRLLEWNSFPAKHSASTNFR